MTTYDIKGMTCNGCATAVSKAIKRAAPDALVTVDHKAGTAKVDKGPEDAAIAQAVVEAGFEFAGRSAGQNL